MQIRLLAALSALALIGSFASDARAQAAGDFYKGRTVYVYLGEAAGGEYDAWGRVVAQHIANHIPGHPTIVPQNVPGAGGLTALNQIAVTAAKDGTVLGIVNRGMPLDPLLGDRAARFDPRKLNWLGSPERDVIVCSARKDAPAQSLQDLATKELIVGATGTGADTLTYPQLLSGLLGLKFKIVKGFPGTTQILLSIEQNELQGMCNSYNSVSRRAYFANGHMNVLLQATLNADPRLGQVPTLAGLPKTDEDRQALTFFLASAELGRPFVTAAEVPADRVAILRQAFVDTMKDPAFVADTQKEKLNLSPITWQRQVEVIDEAYKTPPPVIAHVAQLLGRDVGVAKK